MADRAGTSEGIESEVLVVSHHRNGRGTPLASLWYSSGEIAKRGIELRFVHTADPKGFRKLLGAPFVLFDGIHALRHGFGPYWYAVASVLAKGVAIFWHETEAEIEKARAVWQVKQLLKLRHPLAVRHALKNVRLMHFHVARYGVDLLTGRYGVPENRVHHLLGCSDWETVTAYGLPLNKEPRRFLAAGTCSHRKGTDLFLDIARQVVAVEPQAQFYWAGKFGGTGYRETDLKASVKCRNLESNVQFLGYVDDVPDWLASAESLIMCSRDEPAAKILQEALAVGTHIVAFRIGGNPEIVGPHGDLVDFPDTAAFARALLREPAEKNNAAQQRRRRKSYETRFTAAAFADRFAQAFKRWRVEDRNVPRRTR